MAERRTYQDRRPHAVPASLTDLTGLDTGPVNLPATVAWTGRRRYDLDSPADLAVMYERVIVEAPSAADLQVLLNAAILIRIWPSLCLPTQVRTLWQSRFSTLSVAA